MVSPVTVALSAAPPTLAVWPPDELTVYPVTAEPPLEAGALQLTVAWRSPAAALTPRGAPGTEAGVTVLEAADAGLAPTAFAAVTVNV